MKLPKNYQKYGELKYFEGLYVGKTISSGISSINTLLILIAGLFLGQLISREALTILVICILIFVTIVACTVIIKEAKK